MGWHYARVDHLGAGASCIFCGRQLKSQKGIVITDGTEEAYAGPNCAKKHLGPPDERLLDVARLALLVVSDADPDDSSAIATPEPLSDSGPGLGVETIPTHAAPSSTRPPLPPLDAVIQYLRLRYEAMSGFRYQRSALLTDAYEAFQANGELDEVLRKRVAGSMRSAARQKSVFSERNIKHCIGLNYWLSEALQHIAEDRRDFLESMISKLHARWALTPTQIEGINKWFANVRKKVHGFPHLDVSIFDGVVVPDFMGPGRKP
ncbi:hypothetical protein [Pseudomonas baetica]|uniref:hypothetical protein n=1 Tax=Pseudomonas baetica TaxID=674054 RepID=UPI002404FBD0|nr:hypothetical protein [Pseudomonas baetica]MDF9779151.1 hypothetical protein [Pseudomonas baetica]